MGKAYLATLLCTLAAFAAAIFLTCRQSTAGDLPPPDRMTREDALDLELALTKLDALDRQARPLIVHRDELLKKYQLRLGADLVDFDKDVGKIIRPPSPKAAPPPDMGAPHDLAAPRKK